MHGQTHIHYGPNRSYRWILILYSLLHTYGHISPHSICHALHDILNPLLCLPITQFPMFQGKRTESYAKARHTCAQLSSPSILSPLIFPPFSPHFIFWMRFISSEKLDLIKGKIEMCEAWINFEAGIRMKRATAICIVGKFPQVDSNAVTMMMMMIPGWKRKLCQFPWREGLPSLVTVYNLAKRLKIGSSWDQMLLTVRVEKTVPWRGEFICPAVRETME